VTRAVVSRSNAEQCAAGDAAVQVADLYADTCGPAPDWRSRTRGLTVVALGTLAAGFFAQRYGTPLTLAALLVGLSLNFLSSDARLHPGLEFASRTLLRWGIVLAGLQVTYGQIAGLGPLSFLAIVATIGLGLLAAIAAARLVGRPPAFGLLAGGAVSICGVSAALAIAATLGERRVRSDHLAVVLIGIAVLSPVAMVGYPVIAHGLGLSEAQTGFLLGASIHDVAQAIGAGYSHSEHAGQIATVVKLVRVGLLTPLLLGVALFLRVDKHSPGPPIPWFVIGFFILAGINSMGLVPSTATALASQAATALLALAVTAVAVAAPVNRLAEMGWQPVLVLVVSTLAVLVGALSAAYFLVG
jgi:uncharacterized integral membrane protein (TIGR00698 family)